MVQQKVYCQNLNLGIYIDDDTLDDIAEQQKKYESHLGDGTVPYESIEYTCDIDDTVDDEIPEGAVTYEEYRISTLRDDNPLSEKTVAAINLFEYVGEVNSGEQVTEIEGYIPLIRRIQDLERSGEILKAYRTSVYDGHDIGDDDIPLNPLTRPGVDITDIDKEIKRSKETIKRAQDAMNQAEGSKQPKNSNQTLTDPSTTKQQEETDGQKT